MTYRGIIFDLDGTLIDSLSDIAEAANRALSAHGFPVCPVDAYRYYVGDGVRKLIERALPEAARSDMATVDACIRTYNADYGSNWNLRTCLYQGIGETLDGLAALGIKLNVLSNKPDAFTQACAGEYLRRWHFHVVMGASGRFPHKPDPAAALEIATQLRFKPAEIMYLGDTSVDMKTARNAGMFAIGATWGFRTRQELEEGGAARIIDSPLELLAIARP